MPKPPLTLNDLRNLTGQRWVLTFWRRKVGRKVEYYHPTGEYRAPVRGEWFVSPISTTPNPCNHDSYPWRRVIVKCVHTTTPRKRKRKHHRVEHLV